ncbi:hypothetical protein D3C71_2006820 [compost metagenome]
MAEKVHLAVMGARQDSFRGNIIKERKIKRGIYGAVKDDSKMEELFKIVIEQGEY